MRDIGFDVSERLNREDYFRHQILEYANLSSLTGTGKRLRTPAGRGFLKKRTGSELDINTSYIEAEHDVMAKMLYDIEVAKTIANVDKNYSIASKVRATAKEKGLEDWHDAIPEGYTTWQPREGNTFYLVDSVPASLAKKLWDGSLDKITFEDLKQSLAVGGKRRELVVKEEVAATLDQLQVPSGTNVISRASKQVLTGWKVWTLISPRRFFKYNFRNVSGDADAAFVGNPSGFLYTPRAVKDLWDVYVGKSSMSPELKDWFEMGGMESTLQAQEIQGLQRLSIFKNITDTKSMNLWKKYWEAARLSTDFRESVLRYANYLSYLDQMKKSGGKPKNFGASVPEEIMGLSDIKEKAFWLQNDLLGAYDRISVMGHAIREHVYPFWSWKELNFKRYVRMYKNAIHDGQLCEQLGRRAVKGVIKTPYTAYKVGKFLVQATALWSAMQAWNYTRFKDEEESLPDAVQSRPHIIFGKNENGEIIYFSRLGALGDLLEWFGLDTAPQNVADFLNGEKSLKEIAVEIAKAPVNVFVSGLSPFAKIPAELLSKQSFFPDVFRPRVIRDEGLHIARGLGLENEYTAVAGKPSRGYADSVGLLFYYKIDPKQGAYADIMEERQRFLKSKGKEARGFWLTPRSNALYDVKVALRYGDKQAAKASFQKYMNLVNPQSKADFKKALDGVSQSLLSLNPISGLSKEEQIEFVSGLNAEDRRKLVNALSFYTETLLGTKYK
jgi:hypothetical protein